MPYRISRRVVLFGLLGAVPAACGIAAPPPPARRTGTRSAAPAPRPPASPPRDTSEDIDVRRFGASPTASAAVNTAAFYAASRAINAAGGGTLFVPPGIYRVGTQRLSGASGAGGAHVAADIILIQGCRKPVLIVGTGATLKVADGLRFGTFDPVTGAKHDVPLPFTDYNYASAAPVMIRVRECKAPVRIEGFDLDGNAGALVLGGMFGDTGRQLPGDGISCEANTGGLAIVDVRSRNHARDGIMLGHVGLTPRSPRYPVTMTDVTCDGNGRQGLSWIGGTELTAVRCRFNRTGRGRFSSAPAAGMDIEAEESVCRNGRFVECEFADNAGCGMVAEAGDIADMVFERCRFIGSVNWSAWPRKPGIVFNDCLFVGSIVNCHGDADPARATRFVDCRFHGDPALSPSRKVFGPFLMDLGGGARNVLFQRCDLRAVAPGITLAWTNPEVIFDNCRFRQAGRGTSYARGLYRGTNRVDTAGSFDIYGSKNLGSLTVNGETKPRF